MKRLLILVILGYILSSMGAVHAGSYYSPQGNIKERLEEGITYAQHSIEICMHNFATLDIGEKLEAARERGVRVRVVVLEYNDSGLENSLAKTLLSKGFDVRDLKPQSDDKLVRNFIILDGRILVTGAYNWMAYLNRNIHNNVRFYYDSDRIREYKDLFYRLFTEGECAPLLAKRRKQDRKDTSSLPESISDVDTKETGQEYISGKEPLVIKEPEKTAAVISDGFIEISFEELDKKFGRKSNLSRSEKNELWKEYEGKYVQWRGVVIYRGIGRVDWNRIGVSRTAGGRSAEVEIMFDWRKFENVTNIKTGNTVIYTGRLVSYPWINAPYRLNDGDIKRVQ
jgi:hypothetical protein